MLFSALNGMSLVLLGDLAARTIRAPMELQVGTLIAMLGAPFFLDTYVDEESRVTGTFQMNGPAGPMVMDLDGPVSAIQRTALR